MCYSLKYISHMHNQPGDEPIAQSRGDQGCVNERNGEVVLLLCMNERLTIKATSRQKDCTSCVGAMEDVFDVTT